MGDYGYKRGSYWIRLDNGVKMSTRMGLTRDKARERFRYMLKNELPGQFNADRIIDRIDNPPAEEEIILQ